MQTNLWRALLISLCLWCFASATSAAMPTVTVERVSGLSVWVSPYHALPIIEMQLVFKGAGYASDPKAKQGRAMLAGALLKEGAGSRDAAAFARALEEKAIELSVAVDRDNVIVSLKTLTEHRQAAFELLADMLRFARFDAASMDKIKRQMQVQRAQQAESPHYLAQRAYEQAAYPHHPYAQDALGSEQSMNALTALELKDYMQRAFSKDALLVSLAGDIKPSDARRLISGYLGELPAEQTLEHRVSAVTYPPAPFDVSVQQQLPQSLLLFARPSIARNDANFYAAYILNHILGGGALTSRLGVDLREENALTYGISTWLEAAPNESRWAGMMSTKNESVTRAKERIRFVLSQLAAKGMSDAELQTAKHYITGSYPLQIDTNGGVVSFLSQMQLHSLGEDYFAKRNAYFDAVTLEQINALAKAWLDASAWSWVTVGGSTETTPTKAPAP